MVEPSVFQTRKKRNPGRANTKVADARAQKPPIIGQKRKAVVKTEENTKHEELSVDDLLGQPVELDVDTEESGGEDNEEREYSKVVEESMRRYIEETTCRRETVDDVFANPPRQGTRRSRRHVS